MAIKAVWSGRIVRNGTAKHEFTCHSCSVPCVVVKDRLSDDAPSYCRDKNKRQEEGLLLELNYEMEKEKELKKVV